MELSAVALLKILSARHHPGLVEPKDIIEKDSAQIEVEDLLSTPTPSCNCTNSYQTSLKFFSLFLLGPGKNVC